MRTTSLAALFLAFLAPPAFCQRPAQILDTVATDVDGTIHRVGGGTAPGPVALVMLDVACPIARRYAPRLNIIAKGSAKSGVAFYGVLSDPELSRTEAQAFRDEYAIGFPILFDSSGTLGQRLAPRRMPEAFVVDRDDHVVYRGRIDDWFAAPTKPRARATRHELRDAIAAVAEGRRPAVAKTDPVGCEVEATLLAMPTEVTWARHVAPILNAQCVECHRDGAVGPFALDTFARARRRAKMIARVVENGVMPPWHARPGHGSFRDARVLSDREKKVLRAWAVAGAPEGNAAEAPPPPPAPKAGWPLGKPDAIFEMPAPFDVPADGGDVYRYFVVPMNLTEDRHFVALDFQPGDPTVVHHCIAYLDFSGKARAMDAKDPGPGFSVFGNTGALEQVAGENLWAIGGWAPGSRATKLPTGHGIPLPKGGDLVLELHYHLTGKATKDQSRIALYYADGPVEHVVQGASIGTVQLDIPAGEANYWRHMRMRLPGGIRLLDIGPHMHFLGAEVDVRATLPGGELVSLLVADWDFRWQSQYVYREPVHLPAGTVIDAWYRFDNSASNVDNPSDPPIPVKWGWQTTEEMSELYLTFLPDDPDEAHRIQKACEAVYYRPSKPRTQGPPWR